MPDLFHEREIGGLVCGVDEVGRGPLAGPVVAAAVVLPAELHPELIAHLDDSKRLSAKKREMLAKLIHETARIGVGRAEVEEIDRINILQASLLAMQRAYRALGVEADCALIDGNKAPKLSCQTRTIVGGDAISLSIAAASVVAKVLRDAEMARLAEEYPGYGWEKNAGYGVKLHMEGLERLGVTPHHRRSFAPVARRLQES